MNIVPIAFAFDHNLIMPACICLSSLMINSKADTFYDIFILYSEHEELEHEELDKLPSFYQNCRIQYRKVGAIFDSAFEIRGITTAAYYRLLIPELIPEYDKIIYSDVDVIFREDLSNYYKLDIGKNYIAGVDSLAQIDEDTCTYYEKLETGTKGIIYSGNLIINSKAIREDNIIANFKEVAKRPLKFQDMDVINIVCKNHIYYLPPAFCATTYFYQYRVTDRKPLLVNWSEEEIEHAFQCGIVHYNGQKPWKGFCLNLDIWWEYYRKSPYFSEKMYFDFFYEKLDELDRLPLFKRIKILIRYFVYGRKL